LASSKEWRALFKQREFADDRCLIWLDDERLKYWQADDDLRNCVLMVVDWVDGHAFRVRIKRFENLQFLARFTLSQNMAKTQSIVYYRVKHTTVITFMCYDVTCRTWSKSE